MLLPRPQAQAVVEQRSAPTLLAGGMGGRGCWCWTMRFSVLDAMRRLLESWGRQDHDSHLEDAAQHFGPAAPPLDLLIVDYCLRRHASGIETIARLRELAGTPVPALVITGDTASDRLREAQESGYPLLHKPVMPARLRATMQELIGSAT